MVLLCLTMYSQDKKNEFGKVTISELEEEFYPLDSTAHAAFLHKEQILSYLYSIDGWSHETTFYDKIKIYDEQGFDWAVKEIFLYQSEDGVKEKVSKIEAYTYFVDNGEVKKVKLNKKEIFEEDAGRRQKIKKFTMPNLHKGAVVEWRYKITSPFVLYIDKFVLQEDIPIKEHSTILK